MDQYILALDQGTTSSRAILFDQRLNIIQISQREFGQHFPKPGWVEHNPDEIFDSQRLVAQDCLRKANIDASAVAAVGITNQRETTVVWDKDSGNPIYPAIVWQDRRTAAWCDVLRDKSELIRSKTGLLPDAYFSATKLRWILDHVAGARQKALQGRLLFGTIDTWLAWRFSKGELHVTDPSNASRTMLFNIQSLDWDDDLLELLDIPRSMLPEVQASSGLFGQIHPEFFGTALPLAALIGDQQSASFGNACLEPGLIKNTYGTGCFLLMNTGSQVPCSRNNLLGTVAWQIGNQVNYAMEGSIFMGGAVVQWLRDGLGLIRDSAEVESLALSVPDSGGVCLVPAFAGLGAPYWDQYARGTIIGLTRGSGKGQIARAALESIALQSLDIVDCMRADLGADLNPNSGLAPSALRVDGGAARNNLLMQFQADMLGLPVERPKITETTALGAACLAGLAVGFWRDQDEIARHWQLERRFEPGMSEDERRSRQAIWKKAVERARHWAKPEADQCV